ncbi:MULTISPECIES: SigB/SigF/SigG family RNA polymerase sigma factor [Streptomyces]|uniref:SigB/SigF/SigG family RNA polymerase sigma factor n=1 Tax=Streptomyces nigrescens TaxID=1920 RepID=A0ABY7J1E7_STRNI|nr:MULTISPECIES: SigB/SigF/SigG family RNA polymerase sigma factor [Streptomyces]WAU03964.1 SigB/SigF/SigG family RNA polymerase sigma factor [Streptomyces nigrescens]WDT58038.1 SigB/SigF/SigG family RNA polymerase sigma factor [Streptomyces sp. G7(2002)]
MNTVFEDVCDTPLQAPYDAPSPRAGRYSTTLPRIEDTGSVTPHDAKALTPLFFERLAELEEGTPEYQYARNTLIEMNLSLVRYVASRYRSHSDQMEDIVQVGTIGLIKAIDRFDLSRRTDFAAFAIPHVLGEIKRFFRDTSWAVHVPRRLQELRIDLAQAMEHLSALLDREPTVKELAEHLQLTEEEIIEGIVAGNGYTAVSLHLSCDGESTQGAGGPAFADLLGATDPATEHVEDRYALASLLQQLDERDRLIVHLRFDREMTQAQIGAVLGISQMHVSRLLTRIIKQLRKGMLGQQ